MVLYYFWEESHNRAPQHESATNITYLYILEGAQGVLFFARCHEKGKVSKEFIRVDVLRNTCWYTGVLCWYVESRMSKDVENESIKSMRTGAAGGCQAADAESLSMSRNWRFFFQNFCIFAVVIETRHVWRLQIDCLMIFPNVVFAILVLWSIVKAEVGTATAMVARTQS